MLADTPALDISAVFTPAAETFTYSAYVSTTFSTLSFGPSFSVASLVVAAAYVVALCAPLNFSFKFLPFPPSKKCPPQQNY